MISPRDMETDHIWNALRMIIFNTRSPIPKRLGKLKRYPSIQDWNPRYIERAIKEFSNELRSRPDFDEAKLFTILL